MQFGCGALSFMFLQKSQFFPITKGLACNYYKMLVVIGWRNHLNNNQHFVVIASKSFDVGKIKPAFTQTKLRYRATKPYCI